MKTKIENILNNRLKEIEEIIIKSRDNYARLGKPYNGTPVERYQAGRYDMIQQVLHDIQNI